MEKLFSFPLPVFMLYYPRTHDYNSMGHSAKKGGCFLKHLYLNQLEIAAAREACDN